MAKKQNILIALFSVLLVLALGYITVYALYLYELTQRTFVLTYNLLEYLVAVPLAFFSAAALLCLVLLKKGILRLQSPTQKVLPHIEPCGSTFFVVTGPSSVPRNR